MTVTVAALYRFAPFEDPAALRRPLLDLCAASGIRGTLLLAREGINGTIAGTQAAIAAAIAPIRALPGCARPEEHTSELQSLMRISYAVLCLKKNKHKNNTKQNT